MTSNKLGSTRPRIKWTFGALQVEALKYQTRVAFKKGSYGAYQAARRFGVIDEICGHAPTTLQSWGVEELQIEALKWSSRGRFLKGHPAAYQSARKQGLLDQICSHMAVVSKKWSQSEIKLEASKYNTKIEFRTKSPKAYAAARSQGAEFQALVCQHMVSGHYSWTLEALELEALRYETRAAFQRGSKGAYNVAWNNGWLEEITQHMVRKRAISDVLYIWKVPNRDWFKVGVTNSGRGNLRINDVANTLGIVPEVLFHQLEPDCLKLEKQLLSFGSPISFTKTFDGATEFRRWTPEQIKTVILELKKK